MQFVQTHDPFSSTKTFWFKWIPVWWNEDMLREIYCRESVKPHSSENLKRDFGVKEAVLKTDRKID